MLPSNESNLGADSDLAVATYEENPYRQVSQDQ